MTLQKIAALVLLVSLMFDAGLQANWRDLLTLVRNVGLLAGALIANFVIVPLAALGIVTLFHVSDGVATGVLLMAIAAGVPFVILAGGRGKGGSHELAIGLAIVLPAISTLLVPFAADLIVPGSERVNVPPAQLIGLVAYQFVPLLLGFLAAIALPSISAKLLRITKPITLVALLALLATLVPLIIKSAGAVFGSFGILAIVSIVLVSLAAGWFLAGSKREYRATLAVGTALRNPGLAMAIATTAFAAQPLVAAGVVTYFLVQALAASVFGATVLKRLTE